MAGRNRQRGPREALDRFVAAVRDEDENAAVKGVPGVREHFRALERGKEPRVATSRHSDGLLALATTYGEDLSAAMNALNRSELHDVEVLALHADLVRWLRFLAPTLRVSTKLVVEQHAANLCRRRLAAGDYKLGHEVAQAALSTLLAGDQGRENAARSGDQNVDPISFKWKDAEYLSVRRPAAHPAPSLAVPRGAGPPPVTSC